VRRNPLKLDVQFRRPFALELFARQGETFVAGLGIAQRRTRQNQAQDGGDHGCDQRDIGDQHGQDAVLVEPLHQVHRNVALPAIDARSHESSEGSRPVIVAEGLVRLRVTFRHLVLHFVKSTVPAFPRSVR
jgi:hypothetical protein